MQGKSFAIVLQWNLLDVPRDDHGKEEENTQLFTNSMDVCTTGNICFSYWGLPRDE